MTHLNLIMFSLILYCLFSFMFAETNFLFPKFANLVTWVWVPLLGRQRSIFDSDTKRLTVVSWRRSPFSQRGHALRGTRCTGGARGGGGPATIKLWWIKSSTHPSALTDFAGLMIALTVYSLTPLRLIEVARCRANSDSERSSAVPPCYRASLRVPSDLSKNTVHFKMAAADASTAYQRHLRLAGPTRPFTSPPQCL